MHSIQESPTRDESQGFSGRSRESARRHSSRGENLGPGGLAVSLVRAMALSGALVAAAVLIVEFSGPGRSVVDGGAQASARHTAPPALELIAP